MARQLKPLCTDFRGMLVSELMSTDVVTVDRESSLADAVERLVEHGVGSVVVVESGNPVGLVTETDALEAALETGRSLDAIPVADVGHRPVVTTRPDRTVRFAVRQMAAEDVKKVLVIDDLDLVGILTHTDVVRHLTDIRNEAYRHDQARDRWESSEGL